MRAVVIAANGGPESLTVSDVPVPEPGEGQVRIKVAYAALNPLDTHARAGRIKWGVPAMPFTLGYEYSGKVDKLGAGVDASLLGARVAAAGSWGGCADYAIAPAKGLVRIPDGMDWKLGTVFYTTAYTAWHMLHTMARIEKGDVVLIHSAAGAVGVLTTQVAKDAGATVIGMVGSAAKLEFAKSFGADHVLDEQADAEWPQRVKELTGGKGANIIIDGNGGMQAEKNLAALAPLGQIIYIGAMAGQTPNVKIPQLIGGSARVRGFVMYHAMAKTKGSETTEINEKLISGKWRYPLNPPRALAEIGAAHADFENRRTTGRTLLTVGGDL